MRVQRYAWEDALIDAESLELLPAGAVNMALRLARAINWEPTGKRAGMPSGLYWKNEEALKAVNSSRATYFRYRKFLFDTGFLTEERGNLIPLVPDLSQVEAPATTEESQIEITASHIETSQSQVETDESQIDTPYSEDTYTDDSSSGDVSSADTPVVADAPTDPCSHNSLVKEGLESEESLDKGTSLNSEHEANSLNSQEQTASLNHTDEELPQSQIETEASKVFLRMGTTAKKEFMDLAKIYQARPEQINEAATYVDQMSGWGWYEKCENALEKAGVVVSASW